MGIESVSFQLVLERYSLIKDNQNTTRVIISSPPTTLSQLTSSAPAVHLTALFDFSFGSSQRDASTPPQP